MKTKQLLTASRRPGIAREFAVFILPSVFMLIVAVTLWADDRPRASNVAQSQEAGSTQTQKPLAQKQTKQQAAAQEDRRRLQARGIRVERLVPSLPEGVVQHLDVVYAQYGPRKMHVDLFIPKSGPNFKPAIVVVHGGGWLKGDKTKFHALAQELATRGYVTAAVEYRLGGEAKFPAAIQDCNTAVRWLRANCKTYGIDGDRIGAVGGSAGGHLVGLMATSPNVEQFQGSGGNTDYSSRLQAAVVMAGPLELAAGPVAEKSRNEPDKSNANQWFGKTVDQAPELYKRASPSRHVSKNTPPILFMTGEHDQPHRNLETRNRLRSLGIATGIRVYKYGRHGCWNQHPWFKPMVDDMDEFFTRVLNLPSENRNPGRVLTDTDWGEIRWQATGLELHVTKPPANGIIRIPRLNNPIKRVFLQSDPRKTPLTLKPGIDVWAVSGSKLASGSARTLLVETIGRPHVPTIPHVIAQSENRSVTLAAHHAVTHGKMLRYEPQPHKNTVGYWINAKDWCEWHFYVENPGTFDVHILQGCGKGQGGSRVAVTVGKQELKMIVEDTGHFQNFKDRTIGTFEFSSPGVYTLRIRPIHKAAKAVMDVRQVKLVPTTSKSAKF